MKSIIRVLTAVVFATGLLSPAHLGAQATDVTGEWAFTVTTDQGAGNPVLTFKQDGEKLTGKYVGQLGNADFWGKLYCARGRIDRVTKARIAQLDLPSGKVRSARYSLLSKD